MACNCGSKKGQTFTVTGSDGQVYTGIGTQTEANVLAAQTGGTVRVSR